MLRKLTAIITAILVPTWITSAVKADELTELQLRACQNPFGADDEAGAANRLTPDLVLAATKLVKQGKVYSLGLEVNSATPAFGTRSFALAVMSEPAGGTSFGGTNLVYNDDLIMGYVGIGSQIDGLGHIGIDHYYYGCNPASEIVAQSGLTKLGVENIPNIVTRGVVLDMTGTATMLDMGHAINSADIQAQAEAQGVSIGEGDVVLLHTGWVSLVGRDNDRYLAGEPGLGLDGARWLAEQGVVAIGADNWGLEVVPFEENSGVYEVHQVLLAENGIYILENMNTGPLVEDAVSEFMFVLGQPKVTGAVQAIINPTAIR